MLCLPGVRVVKVDRASSFPISPYILIFYVQL